MFGYVATQVAASKHEGRYGGDDDDDKGDDIDNDDDDDGDGDETYGTGSFTAPSALFLFPCLLCLRTMPTVTHVQYCMRVRTRSDLNPTFQGLENVPVSLACGLVSGSRNGQAKLPTLLYSAARGGLCRTLGTAPGHSVTFMRCLSHHDSTRTICHMSIPTRRCRGR